MKKAEKKSKKVFPRVGKYVFPNKSMALDYIDQGQGTSNLYAKLGLRQQGFLVDVLWHEENKDWLEFEIEVNGQGCHQFKGYKYANS
jgi:hypothetical protein|tara:strand:+ start:257 stop:517 length:261 start_codon:yes stop_codon:yes gene_type:complete